MNYFFAVEASGLSQVFWSSFNAHMLRLIFASEQPIYELDAEVIRLASWPEADHSLIQL